MNNKFNYGREKRHSINADVKRHFVAKKRKTIYSTGDSSAEGSIKCSFMKAFISSSLASS